MTVSIAERPPSVLDAPAEAAPANVVPRPSGAGAALASALAAGKCELVKALCQAVKDCVPPSKDAENTYHKYKYASAESIIEAGRNALAKNGLLPIQLDWTLEATDRPAPDRYELHKTLLLSHVSGECVLLRIIWPVIPDKGRPLDKALAAADTVSLAYWLRDLLLMPRVDQGDDIAARDDRREPAAAPAPTPAAPRGAKGKKPPPADGPALERALQEGDARYSAKGLFPAGALIAHVRAWAKSRGFPEDLVRMPVEAIPLALGEAKQFREECAAKLDASGQAKAPAPTPPPAARPRQSAPDPSEVIGPLAVAAVEHELARLGESWRDCRDFAGLPKGTATRDLTRAQYDALMAKLQALPSKGADGKEPT